MRLYRDPALWYAMECEGVVMLEFYANDGKALHIKAGGKTYARHAVKTHFVTVGEDYIDLVRQYVVPIYQPGDILSSSEKIIALCQNRVIYAKDVKPGFWAKLLCRFVHQTAAGPGAGVPEKMQFAIKHCGLPKVLWAAFRAAVDKLRGIKGTFYRITGPEVSGLDGFYGHDIEEYANMGIRIPEDPDGVCDEIFEKTGVLSMVVDANAISQDVLGKASAIEKPMAELEGMIRDNPAGQETQMTPFILIREVTKPEQAEEAAAEAGETEVEAAEPESEETGTEAEAVPGASMPEENAKPQEVPAAQEPLAHEGEL